MRGNVIASAMEKYRESWRTQIKKVDHVLEGMRKKGHSLLGQTSTLINEVSGYEQCEKLRRQVKEADERFGRLKEGLKKSRKDLDSAIRERSLCQKQLNSLLQSKQSWKEEELSRFTELYRSEIRLEQAESNARMTNESWETQVDDAHQALMDALRERYQEEQLWSDKIRRISTYGTFSLMGLNLLLFLLIQLYIEPRKRARMMNEFESVMRNSSKALIAEAVASQALFQKENKQSDAEKVPSAVAGFEHSFGEFFNKHTATISLGLSVLLAVTFFRCIS